MNIIKFFQKLTLYAIRCVRAYKNNCYLKSRGIRNTKNLTYLGSVKLVVDKSSKIHIGGKVIFDNCEIHLERHSEISIADGTVIKGVRINLTKGSTLKIGDHVLIEKIEPYPQVINLSNATCSIGHGSRIRASIKGGGGAEIKIGQKTFINQGTELRCRTSLSIGDYVLISYEVDIFDNNTHSTDWQERRNMILSSPMNTLIDKTTPKAKPIVIGNDCWIGKRATVLKGVTLGDRSIVALGAIVTSSIPEDCVAYGNPARWKPIERPKPDGA